MRTLGRGFALALTGACLLMATTAQAASTPAQKCAAGKNKTAGKYAACREKAEAKLAATGDTSTYTGALDKCETRFSTDWQKLEHTAMVAGAQCPADGTVIKGKTDTYTDSVAALVAGMRFTDNGDGTVTDNETGLQWEKKSDLDGSSYWPDPHDADNGYTWSTSGTIPDGMAFMQFLLQLNDCKSMDGETVTSGFAGHCDWRLPTIAELQTIVDLSAAGCGSGNPCIDTTAFGPTAAGAYWSSTPNIGYPYRPWAFDFYYGSAAVYFEYGAFNYVRAVRGGP